MAYPPHYRIAMTRLRQVEAALERELETATRERRAHLEAIRKRIADAIRSPILLTSSGFAEQILTQARADLDALEVQN